MDAKQKINNILVLKKALLRNIIDSAYFAGASSAHIGGALSSVDIVSTLFSEFIKINKANFEKTERDYFILSKGHACLVYYAVLAEIGFFSRDQLKLFEKSDSFLLGHPILNKKYGIDFSTGSLGMGLSIGVGVALALKKKNTNHKVYVLVGDGECNEGSIWEASMSAAHFKLDNITAIIDNNNLQQTGSNEEIMSSADLGSKWRSFNWDVIEIDGHNIEQILKAFNHVSDRPKLILAKTLKGKGFRFAENNNDWHHKIMTKKQYEEALIELDNAE